MSIEALIQAHTEALLANTEAVKLLTLSLAGRTPTAEKPKAEPKPVKQALKEFAEAVEKIETVEELKKELADAAAEDAIVQGTKNADKGDADIPAAITYETLRALVLKLASGGKREEIKAASAKHGLATPKDLIQDAKGNAIEPDQAKMEALYADLQAVEV